MEYIQTPPVLVCDDQFVSACWMFHYGYTHINEIDKNDHLKCVRSYTLRENLILDLCDRALVQLVKHSLDLFYRLDISASYSRSVLPNWWYCMSAYYGQMYIQASAARHKREQQGCVWQNMSTKGLQTGGSVTGKTFDHHRWVKPRLMIGVMA